MTRSPILLMSLIPLSVVACDFKAEDDDDDDDDDEDDDFGGPDVSEPWSGWDSDDSWALDSDADTDTDADTDSDADISGITATWSSSGVDVSISGGTGSYDFGMAQTGAGEGGWFGEDCLGGMSGYDECHSGVGSSFSLTTVATPDEVSGGSTTLFSSSHESTLTYMADDGTSCFATGEDTSYYAGCEG